MLGQSERDTATALQEQDQTIGYLVFTPGPVATLRPTEQFFIDQVRQNLLLAALIASAIGAVLGLLFSRTLTRPLDRLAQAARAIAAKDLSHRVEPGGTVEVANVAHAFNDMADSLQKAEQSAPQPGGRCRSRTAHAAQRDAGHVDRAARRRVSARSE